MPPNQDEFESQYPQIKRDVLKVIITNLLIIILLVGLYLANNKFGFLNRLQRFF